MNPVTNSLLKEHNVKKIICLILLMIIAGAAYAADVQWNTKTAETSPATDDILMLWDTSVSETNTVTLANVFTLGSSMTLTTTATNAFSLGDVGFISNAGTVTLADASAEATASNMLVMATGTIAGGASGVFVYTGAITVPAHGYTLGSPLFLSETSGSISTTAPSTVGSIVRTVGYAVDANTIYLVPDSTYIEL